MEVEIIGRTRKTVGIKDVSLIELDNGINILIDAHSGMVFTISGGYIRYVCEMPLSWDKTITDLLEDLMTSNIIQTTKIVGMYKDAKMIIEVSNDI